MTTSLTSLASRNGSEKAQVLLRVAPPNVTARLAGDICVVVDVSGSMQQEATIKKEKKDVEAQPLSVLDIVKHAVKTLVHSIAPGDRLGIVAYSDDAKVVLPLTAMTEEGVGLADAAADSLNANGQTNLWAGIKAGLDMLRDAKKPDTSSTVMVLTDGVPTDEGHLTSLTNYTDGCQGGRLPCTVHTFGFGNELDSKLLNDIACAGDGMYVFIPDAGMVGTAMVNCAANSLVTMGMNARISLQACEDCSITNSLGHPLVANEDAQRDGTVLLGALQFGQSNDAVIEVQAPDGHRGPFVKAKLRFDGPKGPEEVEDQSLQITSTETEDLATIKEQELRLRFCDLVQDLMRSVGQNGEHFSQAEPTINDFNAYLWLETRAIQGLREDLNGQVQEATSRSDWYMGWGRHYLPSLRRAHLTQQCNNFKDPGVQVYGGELFQDVRDHADEVFVKLPPAKVADRASIDVLTAMGFPEDQARRALDMAYDDVEVAAEYLMTGIPARRPPAPGAGRAPAARSPPAMAYSMSDYHDRYAG